MGVFSKIWFLYQGYFACNGELCGLVEHFLQVNITELELSSGT